MHPSGAARVPPALFSAPRVNHALCTCVMRAARAPPALARAACAPPRHLAPKSVAWAQTTPEWTELAQSSTTLIRWADARTCQIMDALGPALRNGVSSLASGRSLAPSACPSGISLSGPPRHRDFRCIWNSRPPETGNRATSEARGVRLRSTQTGGATTRAYCIGPKWARSALQAVSGFCPIWGTDLR